MRIFKKLSIRTQVLIIGAILIAMIPIVIIRVYQQSSATIINQNTQFNSELISNLQQRLSANYANISNLMMNLGYDTTVQKFLLESDKLSMYDLSKKVDSLLGVVRNTNQDILDIAVANRSGGRLSLGSGIRYLDDIAGRLGEDGAVHYIGFLPSDPVLPQDKFVFAMNIFASSDTQAYGENIGFIAVILDVKSIHTELEKYPRLAGTNFFMLDKEKIVYTNSSNPDRMLGSILAAMPGGGSAQASIKMVEGKRYALQSFDLPEISGRILTAVPISTLMKELEQLRRTSYMLLIIMLLVVSIPYTMLMMNLLKPLSKLMRFMKRLKAGNLDILHSKVDLEGYAEIEMISIEFNTMLERINGLTGQLLETTTELYQVDLEKQRAEYAFLQSQINPHFLSNTLDSIKGIAIVQGNREIFNMTTALSTMLRYSVKGKDEVTLREELKIAAACVTIYQGRFPGKFVFEQTCREELMDVLLPKMILQPLVENAFGHGLEPRGTGGTLSIRAQKSGGNRLEITVHDNGMGIEPERLNQLEELLARKDVGPSEHIGIQNVNNRIRLKYGESYGIKLSSEQDQGTTVIITLPVDGCEQAT